MSEWIPIRTRPLHDKEIELWLQIYGHKKNDDYMCLPPVPGDGQEVLICDASGYIYIDTYYIASEFELGMYDETDEDRPVAWMPLPKPYKGEEE